MSVVNKIAMALGFAPRDRRSRRIVAVIECVLNQNARDAGAASYPALNKAILTLCMRYDVGIVQIPCPEMRFLGLVVRSNKTNTH
jgi:predicted secreted protein